MTREGLLPRNRRPDFLIIGAQKAGSTWLYKQLAEHPQVFLPRRVELLHFNRDDCDSSDQRERYMQHFVGSEAFAAVGEKTPSYFWTVDEEEPLCKPGQQHNRAIPEAVKHQLGDDVRLLVVLRHPVWRAVSAYFHHARRERIPAGTSMGDALSRYGIGDMGFYARHMSVWLRQFPISQMLTLVFERDIVESPEQAFSRVCQFLGVDSHFVPRQLSVPENEGGGIQIRDGLVMAQDLPEYVLNRSDLDLLRDVYTNDMDRLRDIVGDELLEWRACDEALDSYSRSTTASIGVSQASEDRQAQLQDLGVSLSPVTSKQLSLGAALEPPCRLSNARVHYSSSIGAFSYLVSGHIYNCDIGRYCSIGGEANLGQGNHPTEWMSTHPFQYEPSFSFPSGNAFPWRSELAAWTPHTHMRAEALRNARGRTKIGNDVWIGFRVTVMPGVTIGDGAVIGAGSVVTRDVEPYSISAGVPARHIRYRFDSRELRQELRESAWWEYAPWDLQDLPMNEPDVAVAALRSRVVSRSILPYAPGWITVEK